MWAFYRGESDQCASKLASLHDASASLRHQLHRKLGAAAVGDTTMLEGGGGSGAGSAGGGAGDYPNASTTTTTATTTSLLDDPSLQYSSPVVVSTGGVLRPTPQVGIGKWGG